jgi:hypothetical protein
MGGLSEWTRGVEWVCAAWLLGVLVLLRGVQLAARRVRPGRLRDLAHGEDGVSYTLAYVLVIPFYLAFLSLVFETTMLLVAKIGTLYAAHAGARSAVVWVSARPAGLWSERVEQSIRSAMAPFVSARAREIATARRLPPIAATRQAGEFVLAYKYYVGLGAVRSGGGPSGTRGDAPAEYWIRKYLNAAARTRFQVQGDPSQPGGPITVTVTYSAPMLIPGLNRFFSQGPRWPSEFDIVSRATLPNEAPTSSDHTLGIDYRSR